MRSAIYAKNVHCSGNQASGNSCRNGPPVTGRAHRGDFGCGVKYNSKHKMRIRASHGCDMGAEEQEVRSSFYALNYI